MHLPDRFLLLDAIFRYNPATGNRQWASFHWFPWSACFPGFYQLSLDACAFVFYCMSFPLPFPPAASILLMIGLLLSGGHPATSTGSTTASGIRMQCSHYVYPGTHSPGQSYTCTSDMAEFIFAFPTLIFIMTEKRTPHTPPTPTNCNVQLACLCPGHPPLSGPGPGVFWADKQPSVLLWS